MNNISDKIAAEIANFYATTQFTMEEIAKRYNLTRKTNIFSSKVISKCIYFSIFYRLVPENVEKDIVSKIANNKAAHFDLPPYLNVKNHKYDELVKDREEFSKAKLDFSKLMNFLYPFFEKELITSKLLFVKNLEIENYIASEDEPFYVPPEDAEKLEAELMNIEVSIQKRKSRYEEAMLKKQELESIINTLSKKYQI